MVTAERPTIVALPPVACVTKSWSLRGQLYLTVVVKATFELREGKPMALANVSPIIESGESCELAPFLPGAELLLTGARNEAGLPARLRLYAETSLIDVAATPGEQAALVFGSQPPRRSFKPGAVPKLDEVDWSDFFRAPAQQRTRYLRGDEWLSIEGLISGHTKVLTRLPGIHAAVRVASPDGTVIALPMVADTIVVDGATRSASLCWRASFAVGNAALASATRIWSGLSSAGEQPAWPADARLAADEPAQPGPDSVSAEPRTLQVRTVTLGDLAGNRPQTDVLPFEPTGGPTTIGDLLSDMPDTHTHRGRIHRRPERDRPRSCVAAVREQLCDDDPR